MNANKLITLAAVAASAAIPFAANADVGTIQIHGVTWTVNTNMTQRTAALGNGSSACIATSTSIDASKIPWSFIVGEGDDAIQYTVTAVAANAFKGCTKLSGTLTFPETVTSIGNYAFSNCGQLTKIASFGGVTSIGNRSFEKCYGMDGSECPDMSKIASIDVYNHLCFSGKVRLVSLSSGRGIGDQVFAAAPITNAVLSRKAVNINGNKIFTNCTRLESMFIPGLDSGTERTLVRRSEFVSGCTSLKVFLAGPLTGLSNTYGATDQTMFTNVKGCRIFVPTGSNWDTESSTEKGLAAYEANNYVFYYGPGRELDLSFDHDDKMISAIPTTVHALTNVLAVAATVKSEFGYDTRISVTNTIDLTGVTIDPTAVSGVTFDRLMFAAKTQAQLNAILGAFPKTTPISIDPTGLTENMVIPETYNNVHVKTVPGVTIKRTTTGFMLIVK